MEKEETWKAEAIKYEFCGEGFKYWRGEQRASQANVMNDLIKEK